MHKRKKSEEKLYQLGEKEILKRLKVYMDEGQIDDDTALIKSSKQDLIINTDIIVESIHFNKETTNPKDVGWKAVSANLSDLACSGVEDVIGITVGLIVPPSTTWDWIDNAYAGMKKALDEYGGKLLGGDCSSGKQKLLSITAIGTQGPLNLHRSNAIPGDYLVTSGPHGLSRLGLGLLMSDPMIQRTTLTDDLKAKAIKAHQQPEPPINALKKLRSCKPSSVSCKAAATDSSDGLLEAIQCICESSKCTAILEHKNLPISQDWPSGKVWDEMCLQGGEDFELVVSLPQEWAKAWVDTMKSAKVIGKITKGSPKVLWSSGETIQKNSNIQFEHF